MLGSRKVLVYLFVFGLLALAAPVGALANGGGSAGDQQYTDPLSGTKSPTTTSSTSTAQAPAPSTQTSAAPPPSSSTTPAPSSAPTTATPTAPVPTTSTPTATTAGTTAGTSTLSAAGAQQLPYTGFDGRLAAAIGFLLVLGGIGLRRKLRRA